jgi:hypothetical protein
MTRTEWRSAHGGLLIATVIAFLCYLLVADSGFGGTDAKVRFGWAVFILGCPMAASVARLRLLRAPIALCVAFFMFQNLEATGREERLRSNAVLPYLGATSQIPPRASLIRLHYATPAAAALYRYAGKAGNPFLHLDSYAAATGYDVNQTDYEQLTELFPVVFKKPIREMRYELSSFEGPGPDAEKLLA